MSTSISDHGTSLNGVKFVYDLLMMVLQDLLCCPTLRFLMLRSTSAHSRQNWNKLRHNSLQWRRDTSRTLLSLGISLGSPQTTEQHHTTPHHTTHLLFRGWDGYLTGKASKMQGKKAKVKDTDRIFSLSSTTSQASKVEISKSSIFNTSYSPSKEPKLSIPGNNRQGNLRERSNLFPDSFDLSLFLC